ncbi:MAG: hypothetical protein M1832_000256 [Thelocarpon impressellum]|nr:MAG: hypothetical protein M1832_000256 [Thelocarpon impressellum]
MARTFPFAVTALLASVAWSRADNGCCFALSRTNLTLSAPQSPEYTAFAASYWSLQNQQTSPSCVVTPRSAQDVARIVSILVPKSCSFAVRSGGHSPWATWNNIESGVTIDLRALDQVSLAQDRQTASIGPGATWGEVYGVLDPLGVTVVGGRASKVGVGGLLLGGGNSFFTARKGLACDNVRNYEVDVVLADGSIVDASETVRPDLYKALRGGGNNFGIVTRFDLIAFEQGNLFGGVVIYPGHSTVPKQLQYFVELGDKIANDPFASLVQIHFWANYNASNGNYGNDQRTVLSVYEYTNATLAPPAFEEFLALGPTSFNDLTVTTQGALVANLNTAPNVRNSFATLTFKNDLDVLKGIFDICNSTYYENQFDPPWGDGQYLCQFQPLPEAITEKGNKFGGNVLGLNRFPGNFILLNFELGWTDPALDGRVTAFNDLIIAKMTRYLKRKDALNPFQYYNYALPSQDPLRGYGRENLRFLRRTARKYDRDQVFQKLVPGGFKIRDGDGADA